VLGEVVVPAAGEHRQRAQPLEIGVERRKLDAEPRDRRPLLGYSMVLTAATLWALNGAVSKAILETGISSLRLSEVRSTGALAGLAVFLLVLRPATLKFDGHELPVLVLFGIAGLALVQWLYFAAIHRLEIGIALLIQYLAPLIVALWARFVMHRPVRRRIWLALALALVGLAFVVEIGTGSDLDRIGVAASLGAALCFALYILVAEREVERRDPISLACLGFLFAALFWAVVQPWWTFPTPILNASADLAWGLPVWLLMMGMIVFGTIVPFALVIGALRHIAAPRAGVAAMLEPVAGIVVAYLWLGEALGGPQFGGAVLVLAGILLAQTAR
jgi:drug/metabolite transporter (DMT)-like permease